MKRGVKLFAALNCMSCKPKPEPEMRIEKAINRAMNATTVAGTQVVGCIHSLSAYNELHECLLKLAS